MLYVLAYKSEIHYLICLELMICTFMFFKTIIIL